MHASVMMYQRSMQTATREPTMKQTMIASVVMAVVFTSNSVLAIDASAQALIDQCKQEAESKGAGNVQEYISSCLDELMQYDTSE